MQFVTNFLHNSSLNVHIVASSQLFFCIHIDLFVNMEKKQEIDATINSISQNKTEIKYPVVPKYLDKDEKKKMEYKGKGSSALLYELANRELEYIGNTYEELETYDKLVIGKLQLAFEKLGVISTALGVIRTVITDGSVSTPDPEHDDETGDHIEKELRLLKKHLRKMRLPKFNTKAIIMELENQLKLLDTKSEEQIAALVLQKEIPTLHRNPSFENNPEFRDFEVQYNELSPNLKLCLLCFSVFPARAILKKRLMVYWWIAEGFIEQESDKKSTKDLEQLGAEYFDKLVQKNFIKPYHNKRRLQVKTCKMPPFIRSAVISIAARARFFDFHPTGKPAADCPSSFRSALLGDDKHGLQSTFEFEKFHAVFNVSENVLDIKPEWIHRMKNVVVLYLGRWQSIGNHYIEVDDEKFLEALGDMKHLKLLSLQGISRIGALPDQVTKLENLTILDLRACYDLEKIPRDIGLLKNLTHLDLSECYLLERIPKGLSKLRNLLVLKGFAVVKPSKHSCNLEDLSKLPKLRKLSIFTGLKEFPRKDDLIAFQKFEVLAKLKVVWGGGKKKENGDTTQPKNVQGLASGPEVTSPPESERGLTVPEPAGDIITKGPHSSMSKTNSSSKSPAFEGSSKLLIKWKSIWNKSPSDNGNDDADSHHLPTTLQKLELQCFPNNKAPRWLNPTKLQSLEKLHIRGGELRELGGNTGGWNKPVDPWSVKILRLRYLTGLAMHWKEVDKLFPELIFLEKFNCPQLTFFPCDEAGVWINKEKFPNQ